MTRLERDFFNQKARDMQNRIWRTWKLAEKTYGTDHQISKALENMHAASYAVLELVDAEEKKIEEEQKKQRANDPRPAAAAKPDFVKERCMKGPGIRHKGH